MTVIELSEFLKISKSKAYQLVGTKIPVYRIGNAIRVKEADVLIWLESIRHSERPANKQSGNRFAYNLRHLG